METRIKILHFEYVVKKLLDWYYEQSKDRTTNDLNILKVLKLHFFVSSARSHVAENLLDKVFNNYVAMPYGHVEGDIYDALVSNKGHLNFFIIDNNSTQIIQGANLSDLENQLITENKSEIDLSVQELKNRNKNLILMRAFELVDLSHSWYSWRKNFYEAQASQKLSQAIPIEDIKKEAKIYSLTII